LTNKSIQKLEKLLQENKIVIASIAPSWKTFFPKISKKELILALKKIGFWAVSETALGVDFVTATVAQKIERDNKIYEKSSQKSDRLYITAACPTCVNFIRTKFPEFEKNIIFESSPLFQHAKMLKNLYGSDCAVVFIGPCPAKKTEAEKCSFVDCVLTFNDLEQNFESVLKMNFEPACDFCENKVDYVPYCADFLEKDIFLLDGGILESFSKYNIDVSCKTIFGLENLSKSLIDFSENCDKENTEQARAELWIPLACPGGCSKCIYS